MRVEFQGRSLRGRKEKAGYTERFEMFSRSYGNGHDRVSERVVKNHETCVSMYIRLDGEATLPGQTTPTRPVNAKESPSFFTAAGASLHR